VKKNERGIQRGARGEEGEKSGGQREKKGERVCRHLGGEGRERREGREEIGKRRERGKERACRHLDGHF
jgi:hypothetical protein